MQTKGQIDTYTYVYMYTYIYIHIYICMYIHIYIQIYVILSLVFTPPNVMWVVTRLIDTPGQCDMDLTKRTIFTEKPLH